MPYSAFSIAHRLRAGETVFSAWCPGGSPLIAETIAREGFSSVILDSQHGIWDMAGLITGLGAVNHAGAAPGVRIPFGDFAMCSRALDCGAEAIVAPMINTPADARAFAAAAKYPPVGERSWGPLRAMPLQGRTVTTEYLREANKGTLTFGMIETRTALDHIDAIAATPGLDALFIGPYDLATNLSGGMAQDISAPEVDRAIDGIRDAAVKAGKIPAIYCRDPARAKQMQKRGFRFMAVASDLGFVRDGAAAALEALKD